VFCIRCQNEVYDCICPDINERLAAIANHQNFAVLWCADCNKHVDRCDCLDIGQEKLLGIKTGERSEQ
jgi:hypothetical protein